MARALAEADGMRPTLQQITRFALTAVPCDWAAAVAAPQITSTPASLAATTDPELMDRVSRIAGSAGSSPGWSAFDARSVVLSSDLTTERRFGSYPALMVELTPIRSVLAFGLSLNAQPLGVLTLYARRRHAFDAEARRRAALVATHASLAIDAATSADHAAHLQAALSSNRTIGAAVGILIERMKLTPDQAIDVLKALSQHTNRKLADLADHLVETGELPAVDQARARQPSLVRQPPQGHSGPGAA